MKPRILWSFLVACLAVFSFTSVDAAESARRGGTLVLAIQKDIAIMNPLVATRSTDKLIRNLMYDSLLDLDARGELKGNLAEAWKIAADGKVYTFTLRRGVRFHHGPEMTAEDAKYALDYSMNPKNGTHGFSRLSLVERVEAVDKYTLKLHVKTASPAFLSFLTDIATFSVIPKDSLPEGVAKVTQFPPGTGPFKYVEWQPSQRIIFERNDQYWGHKPYVDRVVLRPIPDETVRFTAVQAGDVDIVERSPYEWVKQVREGKVKGIGVAEAATAGFRRLVFNVAAAPFNNKKLRQAAMHGIDKRELMQAAFYGFGELADQKYPKGHTWYIEGVPAPTHDPQKAKALLGESGYKGEPVAIMIEQGAGYEAQAIALQSQLKRIGINVKVDQLEYGAYVQRWRSGDFHFKFSGGSVQPDPWLVYAGSLLCETNLKRRAENESGYCDKEVDALFKEAELELDARKRRDLFKQILMKIHDDMPDMAIGYVPRFFTFRDAVKNFTTDGEGSFLWSGGGLHHAWLER